MNRRTFITTVGTGALLAALPIGAKAMFLSGKKTESNETFPYQLSNNEWQEKLSPEAYKVLRKHGTERAFSSPLDTEKRLGTFHCAGCNHPLYSAAHKYDSGTGWPSFYQPINETAIGTQADNFLLMQRTEVHCANCGGHLGHVFNDGPAPTGLRYCMNGVSMRFVPDAP